MGNKSSSSVSSLSKHSSQPKEEEKEEEDEETPPPVSFINEQHQSVVYACSFSPDGRYLATADHTGVVLLRDGFSGRPIHKINTATSLETSFGPLPLVFSPLSYSDSSSPPMLLLAAPGMETDADLQLWELFEKNEKKNTSKTVSSKEKRLSVVPYSTLSAFSASLVSAAFHPTKQEIVVCCCEPQILPITRLFCYACVFSFSSSSSSTMSFATIKHEIFEITETPTHVEYNTSGSYFAISEKISRVCVYDSNTGRRIKTLSSGGGEFIRHIFSGVCGDSSSDDDDEEQEHQQGEEKDRIRKLLNQGQKFDNVNNENYFEREIFSHNNDDKNKNNSSSSATTTATSNNNNNDNNNNNNNNNLYLSPMSVRKKRIEAKQKNMTQQDRDSLEKKRNAFDTSWYWWCCFIRSNSRNEEAEEDIVACTNEGFIVVWDFQTEKVKKKIRIDSNFSSNFFNSAIAAAASSTSCSFLPPLSSSNINSHSPLLPIPLNAFCFIDNDNDLMLIACGDGILRACELSSKTIRRVTAVEENNNNNNNAVLFSHALVEQSPSKNSHNNNFQVKQRKEQEEDNSISSFNCIDVHPITRNVCVGTSEGVVKFVSDVRKEWKWNARLICLLIRSDYCWSKFHTAFENYFIFERVSLFLRYC